MEIRRIPRTKINKECGVKIAFSNSVLFFNRGKKKKKEWKLNRNNRNIYVLEYVSKFYFVKS